MGTRKSNSTCSSGNSGYVFEVVTVLIKFTLCDL